MSHQYKIDYTQLEEGWLATCEELSVSAFAETLDEAHKHVLLGMRAAGKYPKVIEAPQWLKERMERLRNQSKPTLDEVETQMSASEAWRKQHGAE